MQTVEVIVPVRPGTHDRYPLQTSGRVHAREIECADGNLARVWRDAYLASTADVVLFKHDDFCFRSWESFEGQLWPLVRRYPIIGVAGARSYSTARPGWAYQSRVRARGFIDGINRGLVSHPGKPPAPPTAWLPTFFGPPGPVAVLDGCCVAVRRNWEGNPFGPYSVAEVAGWWDLEFGRHFYDIAFTLNATRAFQRAGLGPACYAVVADVGHASAGPPDPAYVEAAKRLAAKYPLPEPVRVGERDFPPLAAP